MEKKPLKIKPVLKKIRPHTGVHRAEITIHENGTNDWRWRIVSHFNGKIIDASSEGFRNKFICKNNLKLVGESIAEYLKSN